MRISLGCGDPCLSILTALTMAAAPPSDCDSSLCIYANVCLDITDSTVIVLLFFKLKVKVKQIGTEVLNIFVTPGGPALCMQIT